MRHRCDQREEYVVWSSNGYIALDLVKGRVPHCHVLLNATIMNIYIVWYIRRKFVTEDKS